MAVMVPTATAPEDTHAPGSASASKRTSRIGSAFRFVTRRRSDPPPELAAPSDPSSPVADRPSTSKDGGSLSTEQPAQAEPGTGKAALGSDLTDGRIEFYHRDAPYFWLSNFAEYSVVIDNVRYPTSEHVFQAMKFSHRPDLADRVRKAGKPIEAVHQARRFQADIRPDWIRGGANVLAMREVLFLKFSQHTALRDALLQTGDIEIVEASPTDAFWGSAGARGEGRGRNELGKALMFVRETLRNIAGVGPGSGAKTV